MPAPEESSIDNSAMPTADEHSRAFAERLDVRRGTQHELAIESLAFGGRGVAKLNGLVVFVDGALPGQLVRAVITRKRKTYLEARVVLLLKHSETEVEPKCRHFGECGGCRLQNFDYAAQLEQKHAQVIESLRHIGRFKDPVVLDPLASPQQYYYRNKMEFSFGSQRWLTAAEISDDALLKPRDFALGLHARGRHDKILDLDECHLQSLVSVQILDVVRRFAQGGEFKPYSTIDHSGFWRHLVVREGKNTGELLVNIVTADRLKGRKTIRKLALHLLSEIPQITTIVHNINRGKAEVAFGEEELVLHGSGFIKERIANRVYRISSNSFFQTNTAGAELLYSRVAEMAQSGSGQTVYDLYCGAGTISLYLAAKVKRVVGFEMVEAAIRDAEANQALNNLDNVEFVPGDLRQSLELDRVQEWGEPNVVVLDPPRAGLHEHVLRRVTELGAATVVYISCNPTTFARDARVLADSGYELLKVQPLDMFPMTPHIETVAGFSLKSN